MSLLLKHSASVSLPDVEGKTPLHWAASSEAAAVGKSSSSHSSPAKTVQILIEADPNVINWNDYEGRTALHLGAQCSVTIQDYI